MSVPLTNRERDELLKRFQKMIVRASSKRKDFELKYKGTLYWATLTIFGRCIVRNARGEAIVASGYGWSFEVTK
jgi:hypothetical protein